jgi:hypothetical protein
MDIVALSFVLHRLAGQHLPAAMAFSWFQERGTLLEIASLLIHAVELPLLSGIHLKCNNLELSVVMQGALHMREGILSLFPRCSACLEAVVEGMCWTKCHRHVLIVMLDAASWILLYASSQILETVSSSKIISNYCMHLRSQDLIDGDHGEYSGPVVFAAYCWVYQSWRYLLCVNLWSQVNIIAAHLLQNYVRTQQLNFNGNKHLGFRSLRFQFDLYAYVSTNLKLITRSIMASTTTHERYFLHCFSCFCLSL